MHPSGPTARQSVPTSAASCSPRPWLHGGPVDAVEERDRERGRCGRLLRRGFGCTSLRSLSSLLLVLSPALGLTSRVLTLRQRLEVLDGHAPAMPARVVDLVRGGIGPCFHS